MTNICDMYERKPFLELTTAQLYITEMSSVVLKTKRERERERQAAMQEIRFRITVRIRSSLQSKVKFRIVLRLRLGLQ